MFGREIIGHSMYFGHGFYGIWSLLIGLGIILIIAALLIRRNAKRRYNETGLELLKMKLVRGEITEEEYLSKKEIISRK